VGLVLRVHLFNQGGVAITFGQMLCLKLVHLYLQYWFFWTLRMLMALLGLWLALLAKRDEVLIRTWNQSSPQTRYVFVLACHWGLILRSKLRQFLGVCTLSVNDDAASSTCLLWSLESLLSLQYLLHGVFNMLGLLHVQEYLPVAFDYVHTLGHTLSASTHCLVYWSHQWLLLIVFGVHSGVLCLVQLLCSLLLAFLHIVGLLQWCVVFLLIGDDLWRRLIGIAVMLCVDHLADGRVDLVWLVPLDRQVACEAVPGLQILQDCTDCLPRVYLSRHLWLIVLLRVGEKL